MQLQVIARQLVSTWNVLIALVIYLVYILVLYVYRAYFDHLSHIPGSKLAAASLWYEFYYDVIKKGQYTWEIGRMHEKYGPIVRINPYEVHINDPEYIDEVYPGAATRTEKYAWAMTMFGLKYAFGVTVEHELHRIRRAAYAHYFSKASLQKLEPGIQTVVDKLVSRMRQAQGTGKVINLLDVYACLTGDVIGQYAYARPFGFLDHPEFAPYWHKLNIDVSSNTHMLKQFPWMLTLMRSMPKWLVARVNPGMMPMINMQEGFRKQVLDVKSDSCEGRKPSGQTTIFYDVLINDQVRPQEKETEALQDEAQTIIGAGTNTTGHMLALITFYIINNPAILGKLRQELATVMSDTNPSPKWQELERLPYLSAVITEGLRIGYGVSHRLQRLFPDKVLHYNGYIIPAMMPVSMTAPLIHTNPSLFPEPRTFDPERFLEQPSLRRYLIPFSRGTRQCAGLNLAYAELYLVLAAMFAPGRFNFELFETDISDAEIRHDFFNVCPRLDSKGIRITVN